MNKERLNPEGYPDPTAYEAIKNVTKKLFRPIVYIASPYSGDVGCNVDKARMYCRKAVAMGYIPIAPHLLFPQFMNDDLPAERELGIHFANILMDHTTEIWVCGSVISPGMDAEIRRAKRKGYRIRYFDEEMKEV